MTMARAISIVSSPDYGLMRRINRWPAPLWVRWWAIAATRAGDGWLWVTLGLLLLASGDNHRFTAVLSATLASAMGIVIFRGLKRAVGRRRPCAVEPHCWARLLPPDQFSFPSGHSITAFAVAVSVGGFYPQLEPGLLFCAASVALSRILLGMHFLSDVLAGSVLGAALGYIAASLAL